MLKKKEYSLATIRLQILHKISRQTSTGNPHLIQKTKLISQILRKKAHNQYAGILQHGILLYERKHRAMDYVLLYS